MERLQSHHHPHIQPCLRYRKIPLPLSTNKLYYNMCFMSWSNDVLCWSNLITSVETQGRAQKVQGKYGPKSGMSDLFSVFKWCQKPSVIAVHCVCWFWRGFTKKRRNERSREEVRLVMGRVRELLNNRKTSDILKMFRMTWKVKTGYFHATVSSQLYLCQQGFLLARWLTGRAFLPN